MQSEVMGHTVTLAWVSLKRSDWTTRVGRGFPEEAPLVATTTMSPLAVTTSTRAAPGRVTASL